MVTGERKGSRTEESRDGAALAATIRAGGLFGATANQQSHRAICRMGRVEEIAARCSTVRDRGPRAGDLKPGVNNGQRVRIWREQFHARQPSPQRTSRPFRRLNSCGQASGTRDEEGQLTSPASPGLPVGLHFTKACWSHSSLCALQPIQRHALFYCGCRRQEKRACTEFS